MNSTNNTTNRKASPLLWILLLVVTLVVALLLIDGLVAPLSTVDTRVTGTYPDADLIVSSSTATTTESAADAALAAAARLDQFRTDYATRMIALAHNGLLAKLATSTTQVVDPATGTTTSQTIAAIPAQQLYAEHTSNWPAERSYPAEGAILPFKRIVAYYGNFYSTRMGALGEYPTEEMKRRLLADVAAFEAADPDTPVVPAIDYVAMVAQVEAGADGMYRTMMPDEHIDKAHRLAKEVNGILILEVQSGLADLQTEIERFEPWLISPDVHLAIDPEFAMHNNAPPGTVVGMVDADDINRAAAYLQSLARKHSLPPKVMLVHRFTQDMVQGYADITPNEHVQIVMVMDGWGPPANKIGTYYHITEPEPVQFTGFKVFYGNDMKPPSTRIMTPAEILELSPRPIFIQYQ